jgi:hypothetical protein
VRILFQCLFHLFCIFWVFYEFYLCRTLVYGPVSLFLPAIAALMESLNFSGHICPLLLIPCMLGEKKSNMLRLETSCVNTAWDVLQTAQSWSGTKKVQMFVQDLTSVTMKQQENAVVHTCCIMHSGKSRIFGYSNAAAGRHARYRPRCHRTSDHGHIQEIL